MPSLVSRRFHADNTPMIGPNQTRSLLDDLGGLRHPMGEFDVDCGKAPDHSAVQGAEYEAPVGEVESAIVQIWQVLLRRARVARYDNFFELGGHSLLALQLGSRLRERFGVEGALREVFAQPSLQGVAQTVLRASQSAQPALLPVDRS